MPRQNVILGVKAVPEFAAGDRVKLTTAFLRNTGQLQGEEATKRWTVIEFDPTRRMVVVDEVIHDIFYFSAEELRAQPNLEYRRIGAYNLQLISRPA